MNLEKLKSNHVFFFFSVRYGFGCKKIRPYSVCPLTQLGGSGIHSWNYLGLILVKTLVVDMTFDF